MRVFNKFLEWMGLRDKPRRRGSGLRMLRGYTHTHDGSTHAHDGEPWEHIPDVNLARANPIRVDSKDPVSPIRPDSQDFDWKEKTEK